MKIISGFQTGADIGAIKAAKDCGIVTGGFMPKGFLTEDGPRPEYAKLYGALEMLTSSYPPRTQANVKISDVTLWFSSNNNNDSPGFICTQKASNAIKRNFAIVKPGKTTPKEIANYIISNGFKIINCAGARESICPGVEKRVYEFIARLIVKLRKDGYVQ
jgi:Circularly permutated YpsA SLOG family